MTSPVTARTRGPQSDSGLRLDPPPARKRKWSVAAAGLLLTLGAALVFAVLWMNAGDRTPVLAVARPVAAGQEITARDLAVVRVAADPAVDVVASGDRDRILGRTAGVDLKPGGLLSERQLGEPSAVGAGEAVVGVALRESELPAALRPGDRVAVVDSKGSTGDPGTVITQAKVLGSGPTGDGKVLVSLVMDETVAGPVTAAVAGESVRLYLLPAT